MSDWRVLLSWLPLLAVARAGQRSSGEGGGGRLLPAGLFRQRPLLPNERQEHSVQGAGTYAEPDGSRLGRSRWSLGSQKGLVGAALLEIAGARPRRRSRAIADKQPSVWQRATGVQASKSASASSDEWAGPNGSRRKNTLSGVGQAKDGGAASAGARTSTTANDRRRATADDARREL